jgi:hypothetical protein
MLEFAAWVPAPRDERHQTTIVSRFAARVMPV